MRYLHGLLWFLLTGFFTRKFLPTVQWEECDLFKNRREARVAGHEEPGGQKYETGAPEVSRGQIL